MIRIFDLVFFVIGWVFIIYHMFQPDPTPRDVMNMVFWCSIVIIYNINHSRPSKKESDNLED